MLDREVAFRQMRETLIMMLIMAIQSKGEEREQERIQTIKNICRDLFELWGIGYQVLLKGQEEILEQILDIIDTLA